MCPTLPVGHLPAYIAPGVHITESYLTVLAGVFMTDYRAAIVTGASRGIGLGIAEALVNRGDKVCITGRNAEPLAEAVAKLGEDRAIYVAGKAHDSAHQDEAV